MSGGELAGALRERIAIARRSRERDALGGAAGAWEEEAPIWAAIMPDGQAGPGAMAPGGAARWRIIIRREAARVAAGDRIIWRGRRLTVLEPMFDPRRPERLTIRAQEDR